MVGQLGFGSAVELPYLRAQGILLLHLSWITEIGVGGIVIVVSKEGLTKQVVAGPPVVGRDIQVVSDLFEAGGLELRR